MQIQPRVRHFRDASAVLVVWSEVASDALTQFRATLARLVQHSHTDNGAASLLDEIIHEAGAARMRFCNSELASVEGAVAQALSQGCQHILVVPVAVAVDIPPNADFMHQMARRIAELNERHPEADILYLGPPFDRVQRIGSIIARTHEQEPAAVDLLNGVIARAFYNDWALFARFMQKLQSALSIDTRIAVRGSALTDENYHTGQPFDAAGPGSSDFDLVLIGDTAMAEWKPEAFYFPNINTLPLSDETPDVAPRLNPVRVELQQMVGRPVNIQAMQKWFLDLRSELQGTPYVFLDA